MWHRIRSKASHLVLVVLFMGNLQVQSAEREKSEPPFGIASRTPWTTSRVVGSPDPPPPYEVERVFPKLKLKDPVCMAEEPGTNRYFVAEIGGTIRAFSKDQPDTTTAEPVLETKRQLSAFSFHPRYQENGYIYVFSQTDPNEKVATNQKSRVSRFESDRATPRRFKASTEKIIIEWPGGGHNGGEAIFGPDGYLYICTGDSTGGSDPKATGQGIDDLLSVMIRIDVDHPDADKPYSIPKDNPFANVPGARPEIWAHGFRNPWRMSFDTATGDLWVGDVGQDLWEMIWRVERAGNYGWSVQEGSHPFHPHKKQGPGPISPPIVEHHHTECRSIVGGSIYHGDKFPDLRGEYVYGDYEYGKIWSLHYDRETKKATNRRELADTTVRMSSFYFSRDGNIYLLDYDKGEIQALKRAPAGVVNASFPRKLSETGLFDSVKEHKVKAGVIPYSVNSPLWSDGSFKERYIALPGTTQIDFDSWSFPDGTVAVKSFSLEMEEGKPESRKHVETRLLVKQQNHWMGYSYRWNEDQTDATLLESPGADVVFAIKDQSVSGSHAQTYHYPSRNECMFCHSRAAGFTLGLKTPQMNKIHDYGSVSDNQLRTFNHIGLFTKPLAKKPQDYESLANPLDPNVPLETRVRSYLHVNCAICHVDDGGGNSPMQLHTGAALDQLISTRPVHDTFGISDPRLIAPGEPERSLIYLRMSKRGSGQMPPLATNVVDHQTLKMLGDWIKNMKK